jgi:type IV secretory pathway TraG/TraD family ATPase VirD4
MRLPRTRSLRTWFFFDEVHALHRLPAIEDGLQTARGFGGAFVLGIHSFAKLAETYGKEGAQNLASLARTKLVLAAADRDTAEHCSDYIGHREVRMMDEAYSYGYSNIRDAATITPRSEVQPLVLPDDIMKLPSLRGFLVFPEGFDAARIKLTYKDYPKVAEGYVLRTHVEPIEFARDADDDAETEAGGRETKDELELAPVPESEDETARPHAAPRQEELNFAATQAEPTAAPQSSLGRSMIASAEIVKSASAARANEPETASKAPRSAALKLPAQRATQAARELAEAIDREAADGRGKDVSRGAEMDGPDHDDGPEM